MVPEIWRQWYVVRIVYSMYQVERLYYTSIGQCHMIQPCEPKMKKARSVFRFSFFVLLSKTSVGFGRWKKENESEPKRSEPNRNRTERFSVDFSVGSSAKPAKWSAFRRVWCAYNMLISCDDMVDRCQVAFSPYLRLLRQTAEADTNVTHKQ